MASCNKAIIATFLAMLSWPAVGYLLPTSQSTADRRALAQWPTLQDGNLKKLTQDIEAYTSDQFLGRGILLRARELALRGIDTSGNKSVILGDEGWMYLFRYQGLAEYSESYYGSVDEKQWLADIMRQHAEYASRGAKYFYVVAPAKPSIYPEFLPVWTGRQGPRTKWQEIKSRLGDRVPDFVIDLTAFTQQLHAALPCKPLFFKTDSHWTSAAAGLAGFYIADQLQGVSRDFSYYVQLLSTTHPGGKRIGDLPAACGLIGEPESDWHLPVVADNADWWTVGVPAFDETLCNIPPNSWLGWLTIVNTVGASKLLIDSDSFGEGMIPALASRFSELTYVLHRARHGAIFYHLVDRMKPDIVVEEHVETQVEHLFPPTYTAGPAHDPALDVAFNKHVLKQPLGLILDPSTYALASPDEGACEMVTIGSEHVCEFSGLQLSGWVLVGSTPADAVVVVKGNRVIWVDRADGPATHQSCGFSIKIPNLILMRTAGEISILAISGAKVLRIPYTESC